jgi:glycosyltransferase involved in cell wall biosynthesis
MRRPGRAGRARRGSRSGRRDRGGRVLIVLENEPAWTSHRVRKQIETLLGEGHVVAVITRRDEGNAMFAGRAGLRLLEYPPPVETEGPLGYLIEYGYSFLAASVLSVRALRSGGVDVVQFCQPPDIYFPLARVLRWFGVRVLVDQRDLSPELYVARYGRARPGLLALLRACERRSHRGADRIICTNDYQRDRALAASGLPGRHVVTVRNGPVLAEVDAARGDESLRRGHRYLCCWVGVMGHQDRVDLLVRSIDHLVHELGRKDCEFALIGPGECQAAMVQLARQLELEEWVHFTGNLLPPEVFRYLASADLGLDASLQADISPVKLYEYMAFGLPVVAFDLPQTRVLAGGAATLAGPGDIGAHARAIDELLDRPHWRAALGETGRARVRDELAWDHQARRYAAVVGQLCSGRGR